MWTNPWCFCPKMAGQAWISLNRCFNDFDQGDDFIAALIILHTKYEVYYQTAFRFVFYHRWGNAKRHPEKLHNPANNPLHSLSFSVYFVFCFLRAWNCWVLFLMDLISSDKLESMTLVVDEVSGSSFSCVALLFSVSSWLWCSSLRRSFSSKMICVALVFL